MKAVVFLLSLLICTQGSAQSSPCLEPDQTIERFFNFIQSHGAKSGKLDTSFQELTVEFQKAKAEIEAADKRQGQNLSFFSMQTFRLYNLFLKEIEWALRFDLMKKYLPEAWAVNNAVPVGRDKFPLGCQVSPASRIRVEYDGYRREVNDILEITLRQQINDNQLVLAKTNFMKGVALEYIDLATVRGHAAVAYIIDSYRKESFYELDDTAFYAANYFLRSMEPVADKGHLADYRRIIDYSFKVLKDPIYIDRDIPAIAPSRTKGFNDFFNKSELYFLLYEETMKMDYLANAEKMDVLKTLLTINLHERGKKKGAILPMMGNLSVNNLFDEGSPDKLYILIKNIFASGDKELLKRTAETLLLFDEKNTRQNHGQWWWICQQIFRSLGDEREATRMEKMIPAWVPGRFRELETKYGPLQVLK